MHAGDGLNVVPSSPLGTHMKPQEFRISVLYRLGAQVFNDSGPCPPCLRVTQQRVGSHTVSCGYEGECIARHNFIQDALFAESSSAGLAPAKEERTLLPG